jgi:hypothetical protein
VNLEIDAIGTRFISHNEQQPIDNNNDDNNDNDEEESICLQLHQHQPSTINHQPSTINHQPSTINHQPSTINHQPSTINHQPSASVMSLGIVISVGLASIAPIVAALLPYFCLSSSSSSSSASNTHTLSPRLTCILLGTFNTVAYSLYDSSNVLHI